MLLDTCFDFFLIGGFRPATFNRRAVLLLRCEARFRARGGKCLCSRAMYLCALLCGGLFHAQFRFRARKIGAGFLFLPLCREIGGVCRLQRPVEFIQLRFEPRRIAIFLGKLSLEPLHLSLT